MKVIQYFLDLKSVIRNPLNSQILKYLEITYCSYLYVHLRVVFLSGKFCSTSVPFKYYIRLLLRKFKKVFSAVKRESTYVYLKDLRYMPLKYCFIFHVSSWILIMNIFIAVQSIIKNQISKRRKATWKGMNPIFMWHLDIFISGLASRKEF